jgi:hypothetical protein
VAQRIAKIKGRFLVPGVSKNGRMYTRENIAKAVSRMRSEMTVPGGIPLSMATGHGAAHADDALSIIGRITSVDQLADGSATFEADIANTAAGRDIAALTTAEKPYIKSVSIRGQWMSDPYDVTTESGEIASTADDLLVSGIDFTGRPGVAGAEITHAELAESAATGMIFESVDEVHFIDEAVDSQDIDITKMMWDAYEIVKKLMMAQSMDMDDSYDAEVWSHLEDLKGALKNALIDQIGDMSNEDEETEESFSKQELLKRSQEIIAQVSEAALAPPEGVQAAARRAVKWIEDGKAGSGFTATGSGRAHDLASGKSVSMAIAKRMKAYFDRHQPDKKATGFNSGEEGFPSPGRVAWDAWGGDAGYSWAKSVVKEDSRDQTMAEADKKPYGDVSYADPGYQKDKQKRYPIDTEKHVRAAWSYINQGDNAKLYSAAQLARVKSRIKSAAKKFNIEITVESQQLIGEISEVLEAFASTIGTDIANPEKMATGMAHSAILAMTEGAGHMFGGEDNATAADGDAEHTSCMHCGGNLDDSAMYCPMCGQPIDQTALNGPVASKDNMEANVPNDTDTATVEGDASVEALAPVTEANPMAVTAPKAELSEDTIKTLSEATATAVATSLASILGDILKPAAVEAAEASTEAVEAAPAEAVAEATERTYSAVEVAEIAALAKEQAAREAIESFRSGPGARKGLVGGQTVHTASELSEGGELDSRRLAEMSSAEFLRVQESAWASQPYRFTGHMDVHPGILAPTSAVVA